MEYGKFGKTGFKVSRVGLGTYYDPAWMMLSYAFKVQRNAKTRIEALKLGLDAGINLIDTAEMYQTEQLVAEVIKGRNRDELFIASKVSPTHLHYDALLRACRRSLKRLQTSYIDLYQIHWPFSRAPIKETMSAMEKLVDDGKIRNIGISNFSLKRMIKAEEALAKHELVSTQMPYSLDHRKIERDILPHCQAEKIVVLPYRPLSHGKLAKENKGITQAFQSISMKHGGKTPAQIALNWLITRSDLAFPIPRASNPRHVKENLDAVSWRLDESDMQLLDKAFPA